MCRCIYYIYIYAIYIYAIYIYIYICVDVYIMQMRCMYTYIHELRVVGGASRGVVVGRRLCRRRWRPRSSKAIRPGRQRRPSPLRRVVRRRYSDPSQACMTRCSALCTPPSRTLARTPARTAARLPPYRRAAAVRRVGCPGEYILEERLSHFVHVSRRRCRRRRRRSYCTTRPLRGCAHQYSAGLRMQHAGCARPGFI